MQLAIVAAGFTPGEADQLRRSMAAWRRKGGLEKFEQRLIDGMARARLSARSSRGRSSSRSRASANTAFPESHAASFALLVYVSAWLKHYEPAAFRGALLNSQPMGFYAPAQLVQDARRHGVEVRPVDVDVSEWDCTLEHRVPDGTTGAAPRPAHGRRAVRSRRAAHRRRARRSSRSRRGRSRAPRAARPPRSRRAWPTPARSRHSPATAMPPCGTSPAWNGCRRCSPAATFAEADPELAAPTEGQDIVADYRALGLTLGRHPLALLREPAARAAAC